MWEYVEVTWVPRAGVPRAGVGGDPSWGGRERGERGGGDSKIIQALLRL